MSLLAPFTSVASLHHRSASSLTVGQARRRSFTAPPTKSRHSRLAIEPCSAKFVGRRNGGAGAREPRLGEPAESIICFAPGGRRACPGRSRLKAAAHVQARNGGVSALKDAPRTSGRKKIGSIGACGLLSAIGSRLAHWSSCRTEMMINHHDDGSEPTPLAKTPSRSSQILLNLSGLGLVSASPCPWSSANGYPQPSGRS
jgi:hypothetical protein